MLEQYHAARSVAEAAALLAERPGSMAFAGGTDLLVQMRARTRAPRALVDLKRVPGIQGIEIGAEGARIGAATHCVDIAAHAVLRRLWPGVVEAAGLIGSRQVQGRATLGGNLCNASPAADSVPALAASCAVARICGPQGTREVAVERVCTGPGSTQLGAGEFVHAIELPRPDARSADAYLRFIPRSEMDIAVVGVGVALTLDADGRCTAARIAAGAVAPTVLVLHEAAATLLGTALEEDALRRCVEAVRAAVRPISDKRASADFRRHVAGVLARRAIAIAAARIHERG
jgi:carbon-monoxide dehydrogenase medium subunit